MDHIDRMLLDRYDLHLLRREIRESIDAEIDREAKIRQQHHAKDLRTAAVVAVSSLISFLAFAFNAYAHPTSVIALMSVVILSWVTCLSMTRLIWLWIEE